MPGRYCSALSALVVMILPLAFSHCASEEEQIVNGEYIEIGQGYALKKDTLFTPSFPPEGRKFERLLQAVPAPDGNLFMQVSVDPKHGYNEIWKYYTRTDSIASIGAGWGLAPGEMVYPEAIAVDEAGSVYISDRDKWVHVFDGEGRFMSKFAVDFPPGAIAIDKRGSIYLAGLYNDKLVHKYDGSGTLVASFSDAYAFEDSEVKSMYSGGNICIDDEVLYMTLTTPYLIRKFTLDGELLKETTRSADFFAPPQIIHEGTTTHYRPFTASVSITAIKPAGGAGLLINYIRTAEGKNVIDVLDAQDAFVKTDIPLQGTIVGTDGGSGLYMSYPTGSFVRYSLYGAM